MAVISFRETLDHWQSQLTSDRLRLAAAVTLERTNQTAHAMDLVAGR